MYNFLIKGKNMRIKNSINQREINIKEKRNQEKAWNRKSIKQNDRNKFKQSITKINVNRLDSQIF